MRQIKTKRKKTNLQRWTVEEEAELKEKRKIGVGFNEIRCAHFPHRSEKSLSEKCRREGWIFHPHENWTDEKKKLLSEKIESGLAFSEIADLPEFSEWTANSLKIEAHRMKKKKKHIDINFKFLAWGDPGFFFVYAVLFKNKLLIAI